MIFLDPDNLPLQRVRSCLFLSGMRFCPRPRSAALPQTGCAVSQGYEGIPAARRQWAKVALSEPDMTPRAFQDMERPCGATKGIPGANWGHR